jgi:SOS-response transcriptional repressor LexA
MVLTDDPPLYQDLMRLKPDDLTPNAWAVRAGVSRTVWSDMRRHGNPSRRTLEKLLEAAGSSLAEFEALRIGALPRIIDEGGTGVGDMRGSAWRAAPLPPVPLFRSAMAGEWRNDGRQIEMTEIDLGAVAGRLVRPASLAADAEAYAVTVIGDAMWPRFRPGRQLLVSPGAPVAIGDDVLVRLGGQEPDGKALVLMKELLRRTSSLAELRQFNPDVVFTVDAAKIGGMHKIIGEAI